MGIFDKIAALILGDSGDEQKEAKPKSAPSVSAPSVEAGNEDDVAEDISKGVDDGNDEATATDFVPDVNTDERTDAVSDVVEDAKTKDADREPVAAAAPKEKEQPKVIADAIAYEALLRREAVNYLKSLYVGNHFDCSGDEVQIVIDDASRLLVMQNTSFATDLQEELSDHGMVFRRVYLTAVRGEGAHQLAPEAWLRVEHPIKPTLPTAKLKISIFNGCGSMRQEEYVLEAKEGMKYYIGRGDGKGLSRNTVCIDDNVNSPKYMEFNRYVRSKHAHITYYAKYGFVLYADEGVPTDIVPSRTFVYRNGCEDNIVDMTTTIQSCTLHQGDIIELGKHVALIVE